MKNKILFKKEKLTLHLITQKINDGSVRGNYYSYLVINEGDIRITHKPLFCKSPKQKDSFDAALRSIGEDYEKAFNDLISQAYTSLSNTADELERIERFIG